MLLDADMAGDVAGLNVALINKCYDNTATHPIHCCLSNGIEAIVKYRNNKEGSKAIVNELIANRLAKIVGIQSLSFGICNLPMDSKIGEGVDRDLFALDSLVSGPAFFVEYVKNITPFSPSAVYRYNHTQLVNMILFDHIVYNKDRHRGNILIPSDRSGNILPIDYTHVFKNQCIWDQQTFIQGMASDDYADREILKYNEDVYKSIFTCSCPCYDDFEQLIKDIPNLLTDGTIQSIIGTLPQVWLQDAEISEQDLRVLKEYLLYRVSHLDKFVQMIVDEGRENN